jgi:hypothetical protein
MRSMLQGRETASSAVRCGARDRGCLLDLCWRIRPSWSVWHRSALQGVDGRMGMVPEVGDVVASEWVHGGPCRDVAGCQGGVPQGMPGDARPRWAWRAVHRCAVRRVVRGTGTSSVVTGAAGTGAGSSSRASPTGRPPTRCGDGWTGRTRWASTLVTLALTPRCSEFRLDGDLHRRDHPTGRHALPGGPW